MGVIKLASKQIIIYSFLLLPALPTPTTDTKTLLIEVFLFCGFKMGGID